MIRLATPKDNDDLYDIYMHDTVNPFLSFEIQSKSDFKLIFEELKSQGELFVYEVNQEVVGTCILVPNQRRCKHVMRLSTLAIKPNLQRMGHGKSFLQAILDNIRSRGGFRRVELFVEADNHIAISFYKILGFTLEGTLKNWFKRVNDSHDTDEHIFGLLLNENR